MDALPKAQQRLQAARRLGQAQGAAVTALYGVMSHFVGLPFSPEIGPGIASALQDIDDQRRQLARSAFEQALSTPGSAVEWAEIHQDPMMAAFAQQAFYADLLVLGQHDPATASSSGVPHDFAENMLLMSGKPALILPHAGIPPDVIGETVVIAWKPAREAARAVSAAMPLLKCARRVVILSWSGDDETVLGKRLDLRGYLRLNGVQASGLEQGSEPSALGELILSRSYDIGADLLVMGCYGHSRAREWVLGGTSRTVLESMTLPVLMSH
ncbi:Universal stress protein UspA and related nucleotide-binding proteins [Polaromonas sp. CG9_12]|nr:Universal stress protein UspA and related nucleotide-binding proteins [Polaromonas sp. CG9_12]